MNTTMKHKTLAAWMAVMLVCGIGIPAAGAEEIIVSWDSPGKVAFEELPDAAGYRIEWASTLDGPWHKFSLRTAHGLNFIPANGSGTRTVAVPMFFRVVATVPDREGELPMVPVPGGTFRRGDLTGEDEILTSLPDHEVTLDAFEIAATPVTVAVNI